MLPNRGGVFEATVQAWFNEILQTQLAMVDVTKRVPLAKSAAEVLSLNIKTIERYIEFLNHVLGNSSKNRFEPGRLMRLIDRLQAIQDALQSGVGEAGMPSDIQKILSGYKVAIDLHLIRTDVYAVSLEEALITIFASDESYAALNLDPNKIRNLSLEQIERVVHELENLDFDAFWKSWGQDVSPVATQPPLSAVSGTVTQTTTNEELEQLYNNLRALSKVAERSWLKDAIEDLDQIFSPTTNQEVRRIYVALVEMLADANDLREMNTQIQAFLQQPSRGEEATNIFLRSLSGFISRINYPPNARSYWHHSVATFARNFPAQLARGGYTTDGLIELIEHVTANEKDPVGRLQMIEYFFKGELDFPEYRDLLIRLRGISGQPPRVISRPIQPLEPTSPKGFPSTTASQTSEVLSQVDDAGRKLAEGGELVSQAGRISIWTYLGIGGNIAGVVLGIPGTLYSAGVTIVDTFDPKVSWTEVGIDVGLTTTAGIGTYYAIGGVLYTGIWYLLTGTVVVAGAPLAIGAGLLVAGTGLIYAKEGKREDREAKDFHETFFQNRTLEQKAKELSKLADKGDDEVVNKTLERLKKWNPELLDPNNPEAQALWRSKVSGEKGEKPFAEEMRDTAKGYWIYWIGSKDDAVSLVVMAQLTGNKEDLKYALSKVDTESYEEFRQGIPNLKPISELKESV